MAMMNTSRLLYHATSQLQALAMRAAGTIVSRDPIVSGRNPNTFGSLSEEMAHLRTMQLPEEPGDVERVEFINGIEGKTRLPLVKYSFLIKTFLEKKKLKEALDVLDVKMATERAKPDKYIYKLLISGCAAAGYSKKAFQLFNQMKKRAILPSGSTYTSLMNSCANSPFREDGLKRAIKLREQMKEKGHLPDERTCHAMIKAFGRCGNLLLAFNVVDEMNDRKMFVSCSTYNFLLQACASDRRTGFRHALLVWRKMMDAKIRPDYYSFNGLLRCARDCNVGNINSLLDDVRQIASLPINNQFLIEAGEPYKGELMAQGSHMEQPPINMSTERLVVPNLLLPSLQLGSNVNLKNVTKSWHRLAMIGQQSGFLHTMELARVQPDIKTFTLLLETTEPTNEAEEDLLSCMKAKKVKLDVDFCNLLIKKRALSARYSEAWEAYKMIRSRTPRKPNLITFGVLSLACNGYVQTKELLDQIEEMDYRANVEILGTLFMKAAGHYELKTMKFIITKMMQEKIRPNKKFFKHWEIFQNRLQTQREKSRSGTGHINLVDELKFEEDYRMLSKMINSLEVHLEDSDAIHPWEQFRQRKHRYKTQFRTVFCPERGE